MIFFLLFIWWYDVVQTFYFYWPIEKNVVRNNLYTISIPIRYVTYVKYSCEVELNWRCSCNRPSSSEQNLQHLKDSRADNNKKFRINNTTSTFYWFYDNEKEIKKKGKRREKRGMSEYLKYFELFQRCNVFVWFFLFFLGEGRGHSKSERPPSVTIFRRTFKINAW